MAPLFSPSSQCFSSNFECISGGIHKKELIHYFRLVQSITFTVSHMSCYVNCWDRLHCLCRILVASPAGSRCRCSRWRAHTHHTNIHWDAYYPLPPFQHTVDSFLSHNLTSNCFVWLFHFGHFNTLPLSQCCGQTDHCNSFALCPAITKSVCLLAESEAAHLQPTKHSSLSHQNIIVDKWIEIKQQTLDYCSNIRSSHTAQFAYNPSEIIIIIKESIACVYFVQNTSSSPNTISVQT